MATGTYSVRAAAAIARRGEGHVRRRAGIAFGETEITISTDPEETDATLVTEAQLDAILHDSNLRDPESKDATTPGLRAKDLAPAPPEPEEGAEAGAEEEGEAAPKAAPARGRRGRRG